MTKNEKREKDLGYVLSTILKTPRCKSKTKEKKER